MTPLKTRFVSVTLVCALVVGLPFAPGAYAQSASSSTINGAAADAPKMTNNSSLTVEHDKVQTSVERYYNSPAERANDDLLITEVKSSLAENGISDQYPVEVQCDHGTILLSGVVASADDAREAALIASNTKGVVAVKSKLIWR